MQEAFEQGRTIIDNLSNRGLQSLALTDWIWALGALVLLVLALKVVGKLFKVVLCVAAVLLVFFFIMSIIS